MARAATKRIHIDEVRSALGQVVSQHFGAKRQVRSLRRRLSAYSSSYTIENLEVELDCGQRLRLVLKDVSPASLLPAAQKVRPHFLFDPRREIETYRNILQPQHLSTPVCYGAIVAEDLNRYWLFLERVKGPLLWQVGEMEAWQEAARWLGQLHSEFEPAPKRDAKHPHLLCYDEIFFRVWLTRAEDFLRHKFAGLSPDTARRFRRLADNYDQVVRRLLELPRAFIHGEFYPSNIILRAGKRGRRICPIDWEAAGFAPGLIDVGALTAGDWSQDDKRKMVAAYREACEPSKNWPPAMPELMEAVEWCQLHLSVQWLGWACDWSPPEQHAQNWLQEALRLTDKLGL